MDAVDAGLLIIRVVMGVTLSLHGMQKLFGWFNGGGLQSTAAWFDSIGYRPGIVAAYMAGLSEMLGGLGVATGTLTPFAAAACVGVMLVAAYANREQGFWSAKKGWEYNWVLAGVAVGIAAAGPGRASIDHALGVADDLRGWWAVATVVLGVGGGLVRIGTRQR